MKRIRMPSYHSDMPHNTDAHQVRDRLMRLVEVKNTVGLGKTRIYELIKHGDFPAPCKPGGSASRWSENEINAWVSECVSERIH